MGDPVLHLPDLVTEIEACLTEIRALDQDLARRRDGEARGDVPTKIAAASKSWLRLSGKLHGTSIVGPAVLQELDSAAKAALDGTQGRARASTHRIRLRPLVTRLERDVLVPAIQHEGSPDQVASRQLSVAFGELLGESEAEYVQEAASCLAVRAYRAAIIMLWAAAVARIHRAVVEVGFSAYNAAADRIVARKSGPFARANPTRIESLTDLQRLRESDLLIVGTELWGYDLQTYGELDRLLETRNDAAHPGSSRPTSVDVQVFATKVATHIFERISIPPGGS